MSTSTTVMPSCVPSETILVGTLERLLHDTLKGISGGTSIEISGRCLKKNMGCAPIEISKVSLKHQGALRGTPLRTLGGVWDLLAEFFGETPK